MIPRWIRQAFDQKAAGADSLPSQLFLGFMGGLITAIFVGSIPVLRSNGPLNVKALMGVAATWVIAATLVYPLAVRFETIESPARRRTAFVLIILIISSVLTVSLFWILS